MKIKGKIIIIVVLLVCLLGLFGFYKYQKDYKKTIIINEEYEEYRVEIMTLGESEFPFGPSHCRINVYKENKRIDREDFDVLNDGKNLDEANFDVVWNWTELKVIAYGEEMDPLSFDFKLN